MSSLKVAAILAGTYGLTSLTGGVIGYVKAGSRASLIAGGVSGVILVASAGASLRWPVAGLSTAMLVSLALVGRFSKVALDKKKINAITGVMIGGGLAVVVGAGLALMQ